MKTPRMSLLRGLLALGLFMPVTAAAAAPATDQVSITSPQSGAAISQAKIDVTVAFSTDPSGKGGGNVSSIEVLVNGAVVATFDNPPQIKSGTHTFAAVDLSSYLKSGNNVTLVARAFHGNVKAGQYADSAPVVLVVPVLDTTPPTITILVPTSGTFLNNPRPTISAVVSDTGGSGVDPTSIVLKLNGQAVTPTVTLANSNSATVTYTPAQPLAQGSFRVAVDAKDKAGNAAAQTSTAFLLDLTPPVASIQAPTAGSFTKSTLVPFTGQVIDSGGSGVALPSVSVALDGSPISPIVSAVSSNQVSVGFSPTSALSEGAHAYTFTARDLAGNAASPASSTFTIDLTPPVVLLSPADGSRVQGPSPALSVSYSDALSGVDPSSLKITLDGSDVTTSFTIGAAQAVWGATSPLGDGPHVLRVQVADKVGNLAQASSLFRTDAGLGTVGAQGGSVTVPPSGGSAAGAALVIPQGALSQGVTFFIELVSAPPPFPAGYTSVGPVLDFGPSTTFSQPVTIKVPYDPTLAAAAGVPPSGLRLLTFDVGSGLWILVPVLSVDSVNHLLVAEITALNGQQFGVAAPTVDPTQTVVGISAGGVVADGLSFSTLTITPEASDGSVVGPNETVTATVTGIGNPSVQIVDLGNGVYQIFISSSVTGSAQVTITVNGVTLPAQTVTFTPVPSSFAISGFTSPLQAGVPSDVTLRALDQNGNTLTSFAGSVELDLAGTRDASENLIFPDSFVATFGAGDAGIVTLPGALVFAQAGSQQVKVLYLLRPAAAGAASVQVTAGPPALLTKIGGDAQSGAAGSTLPQPLSVRLTDLFGNPVQGAQVLFSVQSGGAGFTH